MGGARLLAAAGAVGAEAGAAAGKGGGALAVWVRPPDGSAAVLVEVPADATVADLAAAAAQVLSGTKAGVTLTYQGQDLDPAVALADAGVCAEAVVETRSAHTYFRWQNLYNLSEDTGDPDDRLDVAHYADEEAMLEACKWPADARIPEEREVVVEDDGALVRSLEGCSGSCEGNVVSDRPYWRGRYVFCLRVESYRSQGQGCEGSGLVVAVATESQARGICGVSGCLCVECTPRYRTWRLNCSTGECHDRPAGEPGSDDEDCAPRPHGSWPIAEGSVIRIELDQMAHTLSYHVEGTLVKTYIDLPDCPMRVVASMHAPRIAVRVLH
eukprot:TRINITY_DN60922_c0_g1_i1.p1 TRINITY_DN60922_c0_g1~~TRINITY_DN60922_c0_g1_i1.p1  ORF type:complete len:347 (+),score=46.06 TRINITY_DN60922_c0_g1_i1:62-1042(+)